MKKSLERQIDLSDVSPDLVDEVIKFLYGGSMKLKGENDGNNNRNAFMKNPLPVVIENIHLYVVAD